MKRKQLVQLYIEREIVRRRRAPAFDHSQFRHGIKRRVHLDQLEMLRVPTEPLARRHLLRIPTFDKTGIRPARCAHKNFSAHTSTKSQAKMKANAISDSAAVVQEDWLRGLDLNQRPSGYEPDELPGCSTPRLDYGHRDDEINLKVRLAATISAMTNWLQR